MTTTAVRSGRTIDKNKIKLSATCYVVYLIKLILPGPVYRYMVNIDEI